MLSTLAKKPMEQLLKTGARAISGERDSILEAAMSSVHRIAEDERVQHAENIRNGKEEPSLFEPSRLNLEKAEGVIKNFGMLPPAYQKAISTSFSAKLENDASKELVNKDERSFSERIKESPKQANER